MRGICLVICFVLAGFSVMAQQTKEVFATGKITGRVVDSVSKQGIDYATITILAANTNTVLTGATTNAKGVFTVEGLANGTYTLVADFIGYNKKTISSITIGAGTQTFSAGTITLVKAVAELKGVTVTTQAKLIENRIDKLVFNAEKDLTSQGGVATDILKKVPQVTVDIDGNVELSGSSSIRFLINGKPSTAFGSNIADVLQAIPASQIKSIEVITNPGAKYDAEGLGGIINIILKQDKTKGINGNLSLTGGTRQENGSFNLTARNGNFGINAFVSGNARVKATTVSNSQRNSFDSALNAHTLLQQDGRGAFARHGIETGLGFDWTINPKNTLTGSLEFNQYGGNGHGEVNQLQTATGTAGGLLYNIASLNSNSSAYRFNTVDASLNYKKVFKEDNELEVSVNTSFDKSRNTAGTAQQLLPQDSIYYGVNSINPGKENETEITADYTQPLGKDIKFGTGAKFVSRDIASTSDVYSFEPGTKNYLPNTSQSNNLTYHQKVYAAYAELSFPVGTWFDVKAGGRYERTDIRSYFSNVQEQVNIPGYNTFVPSLFLIKKLPGNQSVKLSFSRRIQRPDYRDLNPFINTADPKNLTGGSPYLQPEIGYRYELSYNRDLGTAGSFMVSAFYRTSDHDIQPYAKYYDTFIVGNTVYRNASVSLSQNIGLEKNIGLNLFADVHVTSKLTLRSNVFLFYRRTLNAIDTGRNSKSYNYRLNLNAAYQFSSQFAGEFFGNFNSARNEVQGRYPSFTSYSFALRKQFNNKKCSIALTANNIFSKNIKQQTVISGQNFTLNSIRYVPFRSIGINFTYKFGKLEFKKDKEDDKGAGQPEG